MSITFTRLGGSPAQPFCTELTALWPDSTAIVAHLRRLNGVEFISSKSFPLTDDFELVFTYRGYTFLLESPFARLWLEADSADVPESIFREVEAHVINYAVVWPHQYLAAGLRCLMLPRRPPN